MEKKEGQKMEKKYELTAETKTVWGVPLHRIRALRSFGDVHQGDLGGWVEHEGNLSHDGNCWVADNAAVFGNANVRRGGRAEKSIRAGCWRCFGQIYMAR